MNKLRFFLVACLALLGVARAHDNTGATAPPVKVGAWVGTARPPQTHTPLLLGIMRSGDEDTPRFLRWLGKRSKERTAASGPRLRVLGLAVAEADPKAALSRLRRLRPSVPVGLDAPEGASAGQTARAWLPPAHGADLPLAFLISGDARVHWFGPSSQAPDFRHWIGSRAERRFWQSVAERQEARRQWEANPVKLRVDRISKLITTHDFAQAQGEIAVFREAPKSEWLNPAKFAPYLSLCVAEQERNVHEFYVAAQEIADARETDAPMLNNVAWKIVDPHSRIPRRKWDLAVRLAKRATRLAPTTAGDYDTLAWALYGDRQTGAAIRAERRALWFSNDPVEAYRSQNALKLFEKYRR